MQAVDTFVRRLSTRRAKSKGKDILGATAGYCSTSLFVLSNDVKMLRGALWCAGSGLKQKESEFDKVRLRYVTGERHASQFMTQFHYCI